MIKSFNCITCKIEFNSFESLTNHLEKIHNLVPPFRYANFKHWSDNKKSFWEWSVKDITYQIVKVF